MSSSKEFSIGKAQDRLLTILNSDESPTLDFKREPHRIDDENPNIRKQAMDEFIKDVIALANGNAIFAGETAYLLLGADDKKDEDRNREIFDVGNHHLTASRILDIVNSTCEPKIENLSCEEFIIDEKRLILITVFPTPYVHETTRRIQPRPDKFFTERTAFIRREQSIGVASHKERETIAQIKRFRFDEKRNPPGVPFGILLGTFVGSVMGFNSIKNRHKIPDIPEMAVPAGLAGGILGATTGWASAKIYKDFYEIRSYWHKVPTLFRFPAIIASFGMVFILFRALGYIFFRILPKPKI